jgi:DNA sulfur modification protein DndE
MQRHGRQVSDEEFLPLLKAHVDHGFRLIREDSQHFKSTDDWVDYLIELTERGLDERASAADTSPAAADAPAAFDGVLRLAPGTDARTGEDVTVEFNRRTNNYLAVAGKPGSGKTQFVKDLLAQLRRASDYRLNFIFFDYAKGDVADDALFVEATRARVLRLPAESIPLNIFGRVNVRDEMQVRQAAQEFADTVREMEKNLGAQQGHLLYEAVVTAFDETRSDSPPYPDLYRVRQELDYLYHTNNRKPDTLTEVMRQLTDFRQFAPVSESGLWPTLHDRTVIIDLHELTVLRELTVSLFLGALHRELMSLPDTPVQNGARAMRTIVVIDEAHHFLRDRKRSRVLERLIREIRSKGASVFLLSQSPDDYDTAEFNFAELLEFLLVLQSNATANKFLQSALGLTPQRARTLVAEVGSLAEARAFVKAPAPNRRDGIVELQLRQFWRDSGTPPPAASPQE